MRKILVIVGITALISCSVFDKTNTNHKKMLKLYAGHSKGGIIENTDMKEIDNAEPDAFSGATRTGVYTGIHFEYVFKRNSIETGIDAIFNDQEFTYNDAVNQYFGERKIRSTQIRIPLTYNFNVFKDKNNNHLLQLKIGLSPAYIVSSVSESGTALPSYSLKHVAVGPIFGVSLIPFTFKNQSRLGFSFDLSRSGKIYDDFYQKGNMPGLSYRSISVLYCF